MSIITAAQLRKMAKGKPNAANLNSALVAINTFGERAGLHKPHRLAQYLAQVLHESGSFQHDKEIWGNTPAQKKYEGRKDLGNDNKGDGKKYMGRSPMQITGKLNYTKFSAWALTMDPGAPDFVKKPDLVNTDPWEGLGPIWYWTVGNPTGKSLNDLADKNNIEMITKRVNGGLNGYGDRLDYYGRAALVLLGFGTSKDEIKKFQRSVKLEDDGIIGQDTRMALHKALSGSNPYVEVKVETKREEIKVPVAVDVPRAVRVENLEKPWYQSTSGIKEMATTGTSLGLMSLLDIPWEKMAILATVLVLGGLFWYFTRRQRAIKQEVLIEKVSNEALAAQLDVALNPQGEGAVT